MVLQSSRSISTSSPLTTHLQHAEEFVITANATKSLDASKSAEVQGNQPNTDDVEKEKEIAGEHSLDIPIVGTLLDDTDKQTNNDELTPESPFDTELEINFELRSMLDDDLQSVILLSGHLDHVCEEVSNLHSRITDMESSILQLVSDEIKNFVPNSLPTQLHKAVGLLKSAVIIDDTAEGEKNKKDKDANPAATQGEHQSVETILSSELIINEGKDLVVHNSKEKKSKGIISVVDDSDKDDLDKQPLSKIFKIMTHILDIQNPIPLNFFVPENLLKPEEQ
ncbi:hypothetical protein Tco_0664933 [Tanacetum coccineum]